MTDFEVGYLTAAIDGEGSIMLRLRKRYHSPRPAISVTSTNKQFLEYLASIVGNGNPCSHNSGNKRNPNWKKSWILAWESFPDCQKICELLQGKAIIKKQHVETMLEYIQIHKSYPGWHDTAHAPKGIIEKEYQLYHEMRRLNQKGVQHS